MKDLIDRQAALDIVYFECGEWSGLAKTIEKRFDELPSAQPDVPDTNVGDMISRQAAIDAIKQTKWLTKDAKEILQEVIERLPSAERHGKWLPYLKSGLTVKCSECGSRYYGPWKHCPNCGTRME